MGPDDSLKRTPRRKKVTVEFPPSRKDKIIAFCEASGFEVPRSFDVANSTYRLVAVDYSSNPPTLVNRSTYLQSRIVEYITAPQNAGKHFRIFDFKRFVELSYPGTGKKLVKGTSIDWRTGAPANAEMPNVNDFLR